MRFGLAPGDSRPNHGSLASAGRGRHPQSRRGSTRSPASAIAETVSSRERLRPEGDAQERVGRRQRQTGQATANDQEELQPASAHSSGAAPRGRCAETGAGVVLPRTAGIGLRPGLRGRGGSRRGPPHRGGSPGRSRSSRCRTAGGRSAGGQPGRSRSPRSPDPCVSCVLARPARRTPAYRMNRCASSSSRFGPAATATSAI